MSDAVLAVEGLRTWLDGSAGTVRAIDGVSLDLRRGETLALLGESGCGKSMTALSILRLLPDSGRVIDGQAHLGNIDLFQLPEAAMRGVRGGRVAMIFQEPATSLNPVLTVGQQLRESLERHTQLDAAQMDQRMVELLDAVRIPDARRRLDEYPFQLSGGMKQRVMIAMALAGDPEVLIADEPTTALDVTIQAQVLELLRDLQRERGMAILLITHDLAVVSEVAHRVAVMYAGQLVEVATRDELFMHPRHPYTIKLFSSMPSAQKRDGDLDVIAGSVPPLTMLFTGCRFVDRCEFATQKCRSAPPPLHVIEGARQVRCVLYADGIPRSSAVIEDDEAHAVAARIRAGLRAPKRKSVGAGAALLEVRDLKVYFPIRSGLLKRPVGFVKAVDGISLNVPTGQTLALVGESGCGKTTVGKGILQLIRPTGGSVVFQGQELTQLSMRRLRAYRSEIQIIFQDPFASLNPRMRVGEIVTEGMRALGIGSDQTDRLARSATLMQQVGLDALALDRFPHEFSGGQRQRIAIARALAVNPKLIICDEPTSALDVSVQAQILNLLRDLQQRLRLSYLFITHNLGVVEYLAHEVAVMYLGRIVERGPTEAVFGQPRHPYTQALLSAVPRIDRGEAMPLVRLPGDLPSPADPPAGCHFAPRCPHAFDKCRSEYPASVTFADGVEARCHLLARS